MTYNHSVFIREEFFGSIVYNTLDKEYYFFDQEVTEEYLSFVRDNKKLSEDILEELKENGLLSLNITVLQKSHPKFFSAPLRAFLDITYLCNLRCKHCFTDSSTAKCAELTTIEIFRFIDEMREAGTFLLSIAGGEPLLRPDIFDVIHYAKMRDVDVSITTNGLCLDERVVSLIHESGLRTVTVSLDGMEASHDMLRGQGKWKLTCENIKRLTSSCPSARVGIRNTVNAYNIHEHKEFLSFVETLGVDVVKFNPIRCFGRARENRNLLITADEYVSFLKNVQNHKTRVKVSLPKTPLDSQEYDFIDCGFGCTGGKETCNISPTGDFSPCAFLGDEYVVGNVKTESFLSLWRKANQKSQFEGNATCSGCDKYLMCRAGCRSRALFTYGSVDAVDPLCVLKQATERALTIREDNIVYDHVKKSYKKYDGFQDIALDYPKPLENKQYRIVKHKDMPLKVFFDPTNACNSKCIHCYNDSGRALEQELSLNEIKDIAGQIYSLGICQVSIAGGEPFLRPDISSVLSSFNQYGIDLSITTNGLLLTREVIRGLNHNQVKSLTVSVDGVTAQKYREIRGVDGFNLMLHNLSLLRESFEGELSMRFSVMKMSEDPYEVLSFAIEQGFSSLKVNKTHLLGRFCENEKYFLEDEKYEKIIERFVELKKGSPIELELPREKYLNTGPLPCSAGKKTIYISSQGKVFPCPFIENKYLFGSLREANLLSILLAHSCFSVDNDFCKKCPAMNKSQNITKKHIL